MKIILASKSGVRKQILDRYNIDNEVIASHVDEDEVKKSLLAEGANPLVISLERWVRNKSADANLLSTLSSSRLPVNWRRESATLDWNSFRAFLSSDETVIDSMGSVLISIKVFLR